VANVYRGRLELSEVKEMGVTDGEAKRAELQAGDILVVEGHGNPNEIGRCAIWDGSISGCVHQNHLIVVRIDPALGIPRYAEAFLNSDGGSRALRGTARSTSGLNTISVSKVRDSEILLPPLTLQQRWKEFAEKIDDQRKTAMSAAGYAQGLFEGLQSQAFSGAI
jgi:type I restriction enzyme S subunit